MFQHQLPQFAAEQRMDAKQVVLRVVDDFGSEATLFLTAAVFAWQIAWPPLPIAQLTFYQALTVVAPAGLWATAWAVLAALTLFGMAARNRSVRMLAMALLVFAWWFTGVVLWSAHTPASILTPYAFVFAASAMFAFWRNAARQVREGV